MNERQEMIWDGDPQKLAITLHRSEGERLVGEQPDQVAEKFTRYWIPADRSITGMRMEIRPGDIITKYPDMYSTRRNPE